MPPVAVFDIASLADVVVIAGPNGVGKSRLLQRLIYFLRGAGGEGAASVVVRATRPDEVTNWGKNELDLAQGEDMRLFQQTLQATRRRRRWTSSLVNFESDRSIQNLQPLTFSWDMPDPEEEAVSWDSGFGFMHDRFQDTLHAMFRMIEAQKQSIANSAVQLRRKGLKQMKLDFEDPMDEFKRVFSLLLAPKELDNPSAREQRLKYIDDGNVRDFSTLSSGEREVVNIAFDFLLRKPEDCIVFFDEPELHLHPELSYKLLQTLRSIGSRNQFVLSTHSPDVITASLDQTVVFLSPPRSDESGQPANQAITVSESDETHQALRMLGQSIGIVALGRRIVLIEGEHSSLDKQTYGTILANRYPGLVLVPSGGKHVLESFDSVLRSVLSRTLWGVDFKMLCDRDSRPPETASTERAQREGTLFVLPRYHLENYFLDEVVWSKAFEAMEPEGSWLRDPAKIRQALRDSASTYVSYAAALAAQNEIRGSVGNVDLMPKGSHGKTLEELDALVRSRADSEFERVKRALNATEVSGIIERSYTQVKAALEADSEEWKALIPGKPVVAAFAAKAGVQPGRAKALYISSATASGSDPFKDVLDIFDRLARASATESGKQQDRAQ